MINELADIFQRSKIKYRVGASIELLRTINERAYPYLRKCVDCMMKKIFF
jgi:hypothetical protein